MPLEDVTYFVMKAVEVFGETGESRTHDVCKGCILHLNDKMKLIGHQALGVN